MSFEAVIFRHAASLNWNPQNGQLTDLCPDSAEYNTLHNQVSQALAMSGRKVISIQRVQNIVDFAQTLVREQFLVCLNKNTKYYRVRRFVAIQAADLASALKYNLDPRRCLSFPNSKLYLSSVISACNAYVVLVVQVITSDPEHSIISPDKSLDYFIEYVVNLS